MKLVPLNYLSDSDLAVYIKLKKKIEDSNTREELLECQEKLEKLLNKAIIEFK